MTKFLLDLNEPDNEPLLKAYQEYRQREEHFDQEMTFLKKKAENTIAEFEKFKDGFWTFADNYATEKGKLGSDYKTTGEDHQHTYIDKDSLQMFVKTCEGHSILERIFGLKK